METQRTFEDLTPEQQEKLRKLIEALSSLRVSERLVSRVEAVGFNAKSEANRARMDATMAGAWAHDRVLIYLERLRSLDEERMELGNQIYQLKQHPYPKTGAEVEAAAYAGVMAPHLAGRQEVVLNFLSVSVQHIRSLLKIVAAAVDYEIPRADLDFLDQFRHLRNHFEHWYDRLPGQANEIGLVTKQCPRTSTVCGVGLRSTSRIGSSSWCRRSRSHSSTSSRRTPRAWRGWTGSCRRQTPRCGSWHWSVSGPTSSPTPTTSLRPTRSGGIS